MATPMRRSKSGSSLGSAASPSPSTSPVLSSLPLASTAPASTVPIPGTPIPHPWVAHLPYRTYACSAKPLLTSIFFYATALAIMGKFNAIANARRPHHDILLRDLMFEILPHYEDNSPANFLVYSCIWTLSLTMIIHPRRRCLSRRLLSVWGLIYIMRCTTIAATSLPDPNNMCRFGKLEDSVGTFLDGLSCGDMIFSGHSVVLLLAPLMFRQAFTMPLWANIAMCCWSISGMLGLLIVRMHYLVDIQVAVYISVLMYTTFHLAVTNEELIARSPWLAWFEHDRYYHCSIDQFIGWMHYMYLRHWLKDLTAVDPCRPVVDPPPAPGFHPCCHHLPSALGLRLMSGLVAPCSGWPRPHYVTRGYEQSNHSPDSPFALPRASACLCVARPVMAQPSSAAPSSSPPQRPRAFPPSSSTPPPWSSSPSPSPPPSSSSSSSSSTRSPGSSARAGSSPRTRNRKKAQ